MAGDLSPLTDVEKELADVKSDCAALRAEVTILEKQNTALRVDIGRLRASIERWKSVGKRLRDKLYTDTLATHSISYKMELEPGLILTHPKNRGGPS